MKPIDINYIITTGREYQVQIGGREVELRRSFLVVLCCVHCRIEKAIKKP